MSIPVWFQQWHLGQNTGKPAQTAYVNRVTADGGIVEAIGCVPQAVWDWVAPAAPTLLLDLFPNAAAAYSLRKLRAAYSGAAVRVRESGGNTEADIGFTSAGELDTAALLAHCGANDGFVTVWYDQSLSNNATQTTAANQPKIVSGGSLVTENGKPAVDFTGNKSLAEASVSLSQPFSYFGVHKYDNVGLNREVFVQQNTASYNALIDLGFGANHANFGSYINGATTTFNQNLRFVLANGVSSQVQDNGGTLYTDDGGVNGVTGIRFGYGSTTPFFSTNVKGQEAIIYDSDQSSNRVVICANINTFYSIYP